MFMVIIILGECLRGVNYARSMHRGVFSQFIQMQIGVGNNSAFLHHLPGSLCLA